MSLSRILIVDDLASLHADYEKILTDRDVDDLDDADLFGDAPLDVAGPSKDYELSHAYQGEEAVDMVHASVAVGQPYAVAFVDVRMPPGIDGIETIRRIWEVDPWVNVVIASAYMDYSWLGVVEKLGVSHRLLTLRKPFDPSEIEQCALAFSRAHQIVRTASRKLEELDAELRNSVLTQPQAETALSHVRAIRDCLNGSFDAELP